MDDPQALMIIEHTTRRVGELMDAKMETVNNRLDAIHTDQKAHASKMENHDSRIGTLETNQKKALIGIGVLGTAVSAAAATAYQMIKDKLFGQKS